MSEDFATGSAGLLVAAMNGMINDAKETLSLMMN